jgi:hypothetical protein
MSYYTYHTHTHAGQNDPVDVLLCPSVDLVPYDTHHKHMDGPQHIRVDVHSENPVRKTNNIFVKITNIKYH